MVVANNNSFGRIGISEAYDYRVAIPVIVVAILGLLFVDVKGHKAIALHNTSSTSSKKLVTQQKVPSVSHVSNLPTLSQTVHSEDLSPGESPLDIQTASPQSSSSSSASASNSSSNKLQTSSGDNISGSPSTSPTNNPNAQNQIQSLIDGTTNEVINVQKDVNNGLNSTLNLL